MANETIRTRQNSDGCGEGSKNEDIPALHAERMFDIICMYSSYLSALIRVHKYEA